MAREYEGRVQFFGVAWRTSPEEMRRYVKKFDVPYPVGHDRDESLFRLYGVPYQPVTFVVTPTGRIAERLPGEVHADQLRAKLDAVLAET